MSPRSIQHEAECPSDIQAQLSAIPLLPSKDLIAAVSFYVGRLGFESRLLRRGLVLGRSLPIFAVLVRDGIELHLVASWDRHRVETANCRIRISDVDALYREFCETGLTLVPPATATWGERWLRVIDPQGNHLIFSQIVDPVDPIIVGVPATIPPFPFSPRADD